MVDAAGLLGFVMVITLVWLYCLYRLLKKPQSLFGHTNIIISPDEFRVKTTLEFAPQSRDSVNHPSEAAKGPGVLDRIFCGQISGKTSDLTCVDVSIQNSFPLLVPIIEDFCRPPFPTVNMGQRGGWCCVKATKSVK